MSERLGGEQRGTMVNTVGIKNGPVFFDSVPNQKAEVINPILSKYLPHRAPLFTDMGYRGYTGPNHRTVNHSAHSPDKRYKFAKNRWSKNGVHSNVAEGNQSVLKQTFAAYRWISPKYSQLYLNEFSFIRNLKYFRSEDLTGAADKSASAPLRTEHRNLRRFEGDMYSRFFPPNVRKHFLTPLYPREASL